MKLHITLKQAIVFLKRILLVVDFDEYVDSCIFYWKQSLLKLLAKAGIWPPNLVS